MVGGEISSGGVSRLRHIVLIWRSGGDIYAFACPPKPRERRTLSVAVVVAEAEEKREVDVR